MAGRHPEHVTGWALWVRPQDTHDPWRLLHTAPTHAEVVRRIDGPGDFLIRSGTADPNRDPRPR